MNPLPGRVHSRDCGLVFVPVAESGALTIPLLGRLEKLARRYVGKKIFFGIRPEHLGASGPEPSHVPVSLPVEITEPMGAESIVYLRAGSRNLIARIFGEHLFKDGEQLTIHINLEKAHLFDAETENVITEGCE